MKPRPARGKAADREVGEKLGKDTMFEYMNRFGFDKKPQLDLPSDERGVSGPHVELARRNLSDLAPPR